MKKHREVKDFRKIERELSDLSGAQRPIILVDTGALIDIQRKSEEGISPDNRQNSIDIYLRRLEELSDPVITPENYKEVLKHATVRLNRYERELSPSALGRAFLYARRFDEFYTRLQEDEREANSLESWLLVKNHLEILLNQADEYELISPGDCELLRHGATFAKTPLRNEEVPRKIILVTSDYNHVARGAQLISQTSNYPQINFIDTRI
ncbi:Uncharacterised protein [uncultured archaeon]|nr:Uncharacterised protein [uncultured archaeon]